MNENEAAGERALALGRGVVFGGLVLLAWLVWGWVLELGILGWDSYPLIAAGRVHSPAELFATLGEELMDGRYPLGHFWRPLLHWSFALDHGLHGLAPRGYHLTDLVLLATLACVVAQLGRRLSAGGSWLAGVLAGSIWVLHPVQLEVLSVPARRAESLALLFTCLALCAVIRRGVISRRRALWVGLLCSLALGSKETGSVALPLVLFVAVQFGNAWRASLLSLVPGVAVWALAFAMRTWVLGGIGGSEHSSIHLGWTSASPYLSQLLLPTANLGVPGDRQAAGWLIFGLPLALLVLLFLLCPGKRAPHGDPHPGPLLLLWLALLAGVSAMAGIVQSWYALPFLVPLALWIGCLGDAAWQRLRAAHRGRPMAPIGAALLCLSLLAQFALLSVGTPARREALLQASAWSQGMQDSFQRQLESADRAQAIELPASFEWTNQIAGASPPVRVRVHCFAPYSLEALADLWGPAGRVLVSAPGLPSRREAQQDAIHVQLTPHSLDH